MHNSPEQVEAWWVSIQERQPDYYEEVVGLKADLQAGRESLECCGSRTDDLSPLWGTTPAWPGLVLTGLQCTHCQRAWWVPLPPLGGTGGW